mmetsp:Transcript_5034/g.6122  ORF Transcript_5034/g.6122 Transcript_5034/m.6122 type:complete len:87 (-) Transcript_5034:812-1072(-)
MSRKSLLKNPFVRSGLPVVFFCVAGSVGLGQLVQGKKDIEDLKKGKRSLTTREFDLEEDYKVGVRFYAQISPSYPFIKSERFKNLT